MYKNKGKEDDLKLSEVVDFYGRQIIDMIITEEKEYAHG